MEQPSQTAASARAKVVDAMLCATEDQLDTVIVAAARWPKIRTIRTAKIGAWIIKAGIQRFPSIKASAGSAAVGSVPADGGA